MKQNKWKKLQCIHVLLVMLWLGGVCAVVAVVILVLLLVSLLPHGVLSLVVA